MLAAMDDELPLALVPAAGLGRRLGGPKALVELGGRTALERVLAALRGAGLDQLRVTLPAGLVERAGARVDLTGVTLVPVVDPDAAGMSGSIRAALAAGPVPTAGFLLHPVDLPLVRAADVSALLDAVAHRAPGRRIVVPSVAGRRAHPAWFDAGLAAEFAALGPDEPAHRVVRRDPRRVEHLPLDAPWLVQDIDTPEDLARARAHLAERD